MGTGGGSSGGTSYVQSPEQSQIGSILNDWLQGNFPGGGITPQKPVREAYGGGKKGKRAYKADLAQWYYDQGQGGSQQFGPSEGPQWADYKKVGSHNLRREENLKRLVPHGKQNKPLHSNKIHLGLTLLVP